MKERFEPLAVDTFGGRIHVEWDPEAPVTPLGQMPFFIEFLKVAELFEPWVEQCPLHYTSPNAPGKTDVLGTILLSILAGHKRYAHITTIRSDRVHPELLNMHKVVSEDSVRRAMADMDESQCAQWQQQHLRRCWEVLLSRPWILDIDTTVKPLYGKQEGAVLGYNPHKPGRPSHSYHTYMIANLRLVLDVEVQTGNRTASSYSRPGLFRFLDSLGRHNRPYCIRGDIAFGNEKCMREAEQRGIDYLFKLRQTAKIRREIERMFRYAPWEDAGWGWQGTECELQLSG